MRSSSECGLVAVAAHQVGEHDPQRRMRVLAAVLAHAGDVALDVAGVALGMRSNGGVSSAISPSSRRTSFSSTRVERGRGPVGVAQRREIVAHACAIASMRHSSASRVPSGVPSSKYARRYHAPSHACSSTAAASRCAHAR